MKNKVEFWILKVMAKCVLCTSIMSISQCCLGRYYQVEVDETLKKHIREKARHL